MRKLLLLGLFLGALTTVSAQKIKIKKGNILLNKKDKIGHVASKALTEGRERAIYDLNDDAFIVTTRYRDDGVTRTSYYEAVTNFNDLKWEIKDLPMSFSIEKSIIKHLLKNEYWNPVTGIFNKEAITKRMQDEALQEGLAAKEREEQLANEARVKLINPFVNRKGEILKGGPEGTEVIGYVDSPDHYLQTSINRILIYDINKNLIAKGRSSILKDERFTTFDGVEHKYQVSKELNELLKPLFLSESVYLLMLEGYIYDGKVPYNAEVDVFKKKK